MAGRRGMKFDYDEQPFAQMLGLGSFNFIPGGSGKPKIKHAIGFIQTSQKVKRAPRRKKVDKETKKKT